MKNYFKKIFYINIINLFKKMGADCQKVSAELGEDIFQCINGTLVQNNDEIQFIHEEENISEVNANLKSKNYQTNSNLITQGENGQNQITQNFEKNHYDKKAGDYDNNEISDNQQYNYLKEEEKNNKSDEENNNRREEENNNIRGEENNNMSDEENNNRREEDINNIRGEENNNMSDEENNRRRELNDDEYNLF